MADVEAWQLSNPPILALAPVRASLDLFDRAGMEALREKSIQLTAYLGFLLDERLGDRVEVITPPEARTRGWQWSLVVHDRAKERLGVLHRAGVVCDFREPNVIRVAPVPLYNTYHDVWRFAKTVADAR